MENNVQKFVDLLQTDAVFLEKMQDAVGNYSGEQTAEAVFQKVIQPAAEEKGFRFTLEDMQEYIRKNTDSEQMMSQDEMAQVAGGVYTPHPKSRGAGATACFIIGVGLGITVDNVTDDNDSDMDELGVCCIIGLGAGVGACMEHGHTKSV